MTEADGQGRPTSDGDPDGRDPDGRDHVRRIPDIISLVKDSYG
ncbi:MAG: RpiR family transcriptional regulator, partial [Mesorhizobium sp.]